MSKTVKIIIWIISILVILVICRFLIVFALISMNAPRTINESLFSPTQYFVTVGEVISKKDETVNKQIRISGAVIGDSIEFDGASKKLTFLIADVPADNAQIEQQGGLAAVLESAVNDPNRQRIQVVYVGDKPELLRNMAQAIMIGELHSDGIFYADEILLKCPSRYEEAVPDQAIN